MQVAFGKSSKRERELHMDPIWNLEAININHYQNRIIYILLKQDPIVIITLGV